MKMVSRPIMQSVWAFAGTTSATGAQSLDSWSVGDGLNYDGPTTIERIIGEIALGTDAGDVGVSWCIHHNPDNEYESGDVDPGSDINETRLATSILSQGCAIFKNDTGEGYSYRMDFKGNRKMYTNDRLTFVINLDNAVSTAYKYTLKIIHKPI